MSITKNQVVSIDYTLTDNDGNIIDSSKDRAPMKYIHGIGALIPGLEAALTGKPVGEHISVKIEPEQAYGQRNDKLMQAIPKERFAGMPDVKPGMQFQANTEKGQVLVTVIGIEKDEVIVDGNHPLAGVTLNFEVDVREIREATAEELAHGHVHGEGGHQH